MRAVSVIIVVFWVIGLVIGFTPFSHLQSIFLALPASFGVFIALKELF